MDFLFSYGNILEETIKEYTIYFRFFRVLLLLRVVKIFKKFDYMNFLFHVFKNSFSSLLSIFFLFILFLCFCSLMGMTFYKTIDEKIFPNNLHFSTFSQSFMTIFSIITLDNWFDLMRLGQESNFFSISIFLILIISIGYFFYEFIIFFTSFLGNFVFLNSFLIVVLESFEREQKNLDNFSDKYINDFKEELNNKSHLNEISINSSFKIEKIARNEKFSEYIKKHEILLKKIEQKSKIVKVQNNAQYTIIPNFVLNNDKATLFFFSLNKDLRKILKKIINSVLYMKIVSLFIILDILNMILFSFTNNYSQSSLKNIVEILDLAIYSFFLFEVCLKIALNGFVLGEKAYLKNFYNLTNTLSVIGFLIQKNGFNNQNTLIFDVGFLMKSFLPLRVLENFQEIHHMIRFLIQSLDKILNVVQALIVVWLFTRLLIFEF